MIARVPLSLFLLAVASLDLAEGRPGRALAIAGLVVGVALAVTVALDRLWRRRQRRAAAP